jgi:vacuolar-type H+-ATPase subunit H
MSPDKPVKPIRIIDISRKLNISTATVSDFLKQNCYPVERSHHTPLLPEILEKIIDEFCGNESTVLLSQLTNASKEWTERNPDIVKKIRGVRKRSLERKRLRDERSQRVKAGRERAKQIREQIEEKRKQFNTQMASAADEKSENKGSIAVSGLFLEIIQIALALEDKRKLSLLEYLKQFHEKTGAE